MIPVITDDPTDTPFTVEEINNYLDLEDFDRCKETLSFLLRAVCRDRKYWIWSYLSCDNSLNCVVVTKMQAEGKHPLDGLIMGCGIFDTPIANRQELVAELLQKDV
jgi:hypothetical protein